MDDVQTTLNVLLARNPISLNARVANTWAEGLGLVFKEALDTPC
jgi:hypothetical protein